MAEEKNSNDLKPFIFMTLIDFTFAVVNILLKEVLDQGMNHLVLITYRLAVSSIFLAAIGYFSKRNCRPKLTFRALCMLFLSGLVGLLLLIMLQRILSFPFLHIHLPIQNVFNDGTCFQPCS